MALAHISDENGLSIIGTTFRVQPDPPGYSIRVSVDGVDDLLIVANGNEVMILLRGSSQTVRDFAVDMLLSTTKPVDR